METTPGIAAATAMRMCVGLSPDQALDVTELALRCGVTCFRDEFRGDFADVLGFYYRRDNRRDEITVSRKLPVPRRRLISAQLLGLVVLRRSDAGADDSRILREPDLLDTRARNAFATSFACELLAPHELVNELYEQGLDIVEMSEQLRIPTAVLRHHLAQA